VVSVWLGPPSGTPVGIIADVCDGMEVLASGGTTTEPAARGGSIRISRYVVRQLHDATRDGSGLIYGEDVFIPLWPRLVHHGEDGPPPSPSKFHPWPL